jgi:transposase
VRGRRGTRRRPEADPGVQRHEVRNLEGEKLDGWLEEAEACGAPAMRRFAVGLKKDLAAVRAGLRETWSNGPVEGFVHKLKLLKRQGYGRAGFDLLRARMLAA